MPSEQNLDIFVPRLYRGGGPFPVAGGIQVNRNARLPAFRFPLRRNFQRVDSASQLNLRNSNEKREKEKKKKLKHREKKKKRKHFFHFLILNGKNGTRFERSDAFNRFVFPPVSTIRTFPSSSTREGAV